MKFKSKGAAKGAEKPLKTPAERLEGLSRRMMVSSAIAVLCVLVCGFAIVQAQAKVDQVTKDMVDVVIMAKNVRKGTVVTAEDLQVRQVPKSYVSEGSLSEIGKAVGHRACIELAIGTQLTLQMLDGKTNTSSLSGRLAKGKRAVTLSVDDESGLANLLVPGDRVNVYAGAKGVTQMFSVLAADVEVVALGSKLEKDEGEYTSVTLQVSASEARAIRRAQAGGYALTLDLEPQSKGGGKE